MSRIQENDMGKIQTGTLKYADFLSELCEAKAMKYSELAKKVGAPEGTIYEFFKGKHCPNAALAKAIEAELGVNLRPEYYGWGSAIKP